jgi:Recombination endonuclease VII
VPLFAAAREKRRLRCKAYYYANRERLLRQMREQRRIGKPTRPDPGFCEICGSPPTGKWKVLALDHNHATGKFRGWLCNHCNRLLGMARDSAVTLRRAAAYLEIL